MQPRGRIRAAYAIRRIADPPVASYKVHTSMASRMPRSRFDSSTPDEKSPASPELGRLTARELEIVEWIIEAKRNCEIAEIVGCSPRTVQKHVQNILGKLCLETRIAICAWWFGQQLARKNRTLPPRKKLRD
jgi:DNA-binding NarL/FixJ family response regulator